MENYTAITLRDLLKWEHLVLGTDIIPKQRVSSLLVGKHASMMRGRGLDFEEVRNYVAGDDIRNIDWKVTARTRRTHTKVFNEEKERPALIVVDQSSYMLMGSQLYLKSVIAAHTAALAAFRTIKKGDRCGGIVFNDHQIDWFAPRRSRQAVLQLLKAVSNQNNELLERQQVTDNSEQLEKTLKRIANYVTHDYIITLISDFSQCSPASFRIIKQLSVHNDVILVHIEDQLDVLTNISDMLITDGDKQLFWRKLKPETIQREKAEEQALKEKLKQIQRRYKTPVLYLNTAQPLEEQMRDIFKSK
ncbi:DUF58 domain-containing protein [Carboxylicivirga taeanensis]|uniref:DUF58 domain-containing protein n=1 Tax=Carboxylicivirga taeanensis TaxID=1416875 RepID=UPI003F6DCCEB